MEEVAEQPTQQRGKWTLTWIILHSEFWRDQEKFADSFHGPRLGLESF